jgi:glucosyl-dolichyl phosphate glucuronosyltransferase
MAISLIICTYNRCRNLGDTLASVAGSVLPNSIDWEVLVVDNNSRDHTRRVVEGFCRRYPGRFRYLFESRQGKSHALNTGVRQARGDIIAFTDDDVTVEPTWLWNLTAALHQDQWAGTGGRILPMRSLVPPRWMSLTDSTTGAPLFGLFDLGDRPGKLEQAPHGGNMAFRKVMFEKYGGFRTDLGPPPNDVGGEDTELGRRLMAAGERLRYEPSAVVRHPVIEDRLERKYFLTWWFKMGRTIIREEEPRPPIRRVPRNYIRIPDRVLRRLPLATLMWIGTLDPRLRFKKRCHVYMIAGETWEIICESRLAARFLTSLMKYRGSNGALAGNLPEGAKVVSRAACSENGTRRSSRNGHGLKQSPVFSIILASRDRISMLRRAVSSVCRQSFSDFELIIIDDGSTNFPGDLLPEDPRIRILRNSSSLGVAQARNLGIQAARGAFISFLDDDDEYLRSFLSSTYASLRNAPEHVGVSWCGVKFLDYSREVGRSPRVRIRKCAASGNRYAVLNDFLSIGTGYGVTIKAECLEKVGPFNSALRTCEDTDMFFRILVHGYTPVPVPGVHVVCHNHNEFRLTTAVTDDEHIRTCEWLWAEHSDFLFENPVLRANYRRFVDSLKVERADIEASGQGSEFAKKQRLAAISSWFHARSRGTRPWNR